MKRWRYAWIDVYRAYRGGFGPILSAWFASVDIAQIEIHNRLRRF